MPPKAASSSSTGDASARRSGRTPPVPNSLARPPSSLPVRWEDSFGEGGHSGIEPAVPLRPLEAYDEAAQLKAPRGNELHQLLEEDAAASSMYAAELARLQSELHRHTRTTTDMVKYLEAEVRRKDLMSKRMQNQLVHLKQTHAEQLGLMTQQFEQTGKYMEKLFMDKEKQMMGLNSKLEAQIASMSDLASMRTALAQELESTKKLIFANESAHKVQLDALEKKFLAARDGLAAEAAQRISASRATYKLDVGRELEEESALVRSENDSLRGALKLHEATSDRLQQESASLTQRIHRAKQDLELRAEQNEAYVKKAHIQTQKIDRLTRETAEMEALLLAELQRAEERRMAMEQSRAAQIAPVSDALAHARLLGKEVDARNSLLRRRARKALAQRKELHAFFLAALDETKATIRRRGELQKKEQSLLQAAQLRELTLPASLRTKLPSIHARGSGSSEQSRPEGRGGPSIFQGTPLALGDLTLSEREKVLRLLYAKLTHTPSGITLTLPAHSFAPAALLEASSGAGAGAGGAQRPQATLPQPPVIPMLSLPSSFAAAAPTQSSSQAQLTAGFGPGTAHSSSSTAASASEAPAAAQQPQLQGASYDDTFLTNFAGDDISDDDDAYDSEDDEEQRNEAEDVD